MKLTERNEKQRDFFNEKIDTYDEVHSTFMATKEVLADNLPLDTQNVLDLGVGTGLELIHLFEVFPEVKVTGIDIAENMLVELAKRPFAQNVKIICGDFFKVDFGTSYDAVISTSALHHFTKEEKRKLYKKIFNSLQTSGMFINCDKISLTQEDENRVFYELEHNIDNYKHIDTPLTIESELSLLKEIGFSDIFVLSVDKEDYRLIKAYKK